MNTFDLTYDERLHLRRPVNGQGGFQSLMRRLERASFQNRVTLSDADLGRVVRCASYCRGGYEGRIARAFGRSLRERMAVAG